MSRKTNQVDDFFSKEITRARRFYLNMGPVARGPLAVAAGGWEACAAGYHVARQDFPYFSIEFVMAGKGQVVLAGRTLPLVAGSVFSYGPGVPHVITSDQTDCLEKFFVDFRGRDALQLMNQAGLEPGACEAVVGTSRISLLFEEVVKMGSHPKAGAARGAGLALELLLLALAQERATSNDVGSARATFDRCHVYMQEHFLDLRTVTDLASACHIDGTYLCRLYQRFLGQSPYRSLGRLQMGWVAERLMEKGRLVREVAQKLDMDPFQLSRTFRRIHGVSPKQFIQLRRR